MLKSGTGRYENIWAIISRRIRLTGHAARIGEEWRCTQGFGKET